MVGALSAGHDVHVIILNASHLLKFIDLRKTPSLEFGLMLIFSYSPYALAEGLHLSGMNLVNFFSLVFIIII